MLAALAIAAVTLLNDIPNGPLSREVVANIGDQLLDRVFPDARDLEQAAFVTIEPDGSVGCMLWPLTDERAASTYHGVVPPNAVAIIHTHPPACRSSFLVPKGKSWSAGEPADQPSKR